MYPAIYINFAFKDGPTGGGNQFLKALYGRFKKFGIAVDNPAEAQVVIINSHHSLAAALELRRTYPALTFVHRIDGPMRLYNQPGDPRDNLVFLANRCLADATVFQSHWSRQRNHDLGLAFNDLETIIYNAPDPRIFNRIGKSVYGGARKPRVIASSWSDNWKKGFRCYWYLDTHAVPSEFEMTFVGKSPLKFQNIKMFEPLDSTALASVLKQHDIYLTASENDPCSNSLIEARHCGLPVIASRSGGHPELVEEGGEFFDSPEEIPGLVADIADNYQHYARGGGLPGIDAVAEAYADFCRRAAAHKAKTAEEGKESPYAAEMEKEMAEDRLRDLLGLERTKKQSIHNLLTRCRTLFLCETPLDESGLRDS